MRLLVTGGAGFIGSCFVRLALAEFDPVEILNLDCLTYAGNLDNLDSAARDPRHTFIRGDIRDPDLISGLIAEKRPDAIIHFAAESHVDRSILSPAPVFETNLRGTFNLLEAARQHGIARFLQVSTDEVYGSVAPPAEADEDYPLRSASPYSASKAGADLLALSYHTTFKLPVVVTRASNNYGPYQFPEKLIPLMISNALEEKPLPVYGDGMQIRDWLYVEDHCRAIRAVLEKGKDGQVYNIGGDCSLPNIDVVRRILALTGRPESLIRYVADRPGHDRRYALSSARLTALTGWTPRMSFEQGLGKTIAWYQANPEWVRRVKSGEYRDYYERNYGARS